MKSYRIVRITQVNHYPQAVQAVYWAHPGLAAQPYAVQQEVFFAHGMIYSDGFARAMRRLGHDAHEIIYDLAPMQKAWAAEYGFEYDPQNWQPYILLAQLVALKPDVIYAQSHFVIPHVLRRALKDRFPFIKRVLLYSGFPGAEKDLGDVDLLFAGTPTMADAYRQAGCPTQLMYHGFDAEFAERTQPPSAAADAAPVYPITFLGSSGYGYGLGHQSRYWLLRELLEKTPLEVWLTEPAPSTAIQPQAVADYRAQLSALASVEAHPSEALLQLALAADTSVALKKLMLQALTKRILPPEPLEPDIPLGLLFSERSHPPVYGLDLYQLLAHSEVAFNRHTDAAKDCIGNMRMFEATGVGACLLTDTGRNMADLFEADREVVTYSSTDECLEKVQYLLSHPAERLAIARAGQQRTLRDHTLFKRCQQIDAALQKLL